jgi:hypothetical protein
MGWFFLIQSMALWLASRLGAPAEAVLDSRESPRVISIEVV